MNLSRIYEKIKDRGINIFEHNIQGIKGLVIKIDNEYTIFINHNEIKDSDEEFYVLAHEYGHCITDSTHKLGSDLNLIKKHEYEADHGAVLEFLPIELIRNAIEQGCKSSQKLSEYFEMPEKFVNMALDHYSIDLTN